MNKQNSVAVFSIAALVGIGSLVYSGGIFDSNVPSGLYNEPLGIQGFVEAVQTDADGNVVRIVQTDNIVPTLGKTCALARLFIDPAANTNSTANSFCLSQNGSYFDVIGLGNSAGPEGVGNLGYGSTEITNSGEKTTAGISNGTGTVYATIQHQFSSLTATVDEVVLAASNNGIGTNNATGTTGILARKVIDPPVQLTTSDSLTITWRITAG